MVILWNVSEGFAKEGMCVCVGGVRASSEDE